MATRKDVSDPWGSQNLGPPINREHKEFCPTIGRDGHTFFFVSTRPSHCGDAPNGDIYTTRFVNQLQVESVTHPDAT